MKRKTKIKLKRIVQFILGPFRPLLRNRVYTIRSGPAKGLKRKGGFGFLPFFQDEEDRFYSALDMQEYIVYDIGANVGIMSILYAKKVGPKGFVYCFEPNPDSALQVSAILKLNNFSNAEVHAIAIGDSIKKGTLVVHTDEIGTGSLNTEISDSFIRQGHNRFYNVDVYPLDSYIKNKKMPFPDFIKIDTEGYEFQCLLGMRNILEKKHPMLFIEMHAISSTHAVSNAKNVVTYLEKYGYSIYSVRHKKEVTSTNYFIAKTGHLFCDWVNPAYQKDDVR